MESIGRYSAAIYRLTQSIFTNKLKALDIGSGQYDFFLIIAKNEGISQKEICDMLYVEKSTTAKAVKYLLSRGYIVNRQVESDKRYSSLYLTEKGREAWTAVEAVFSEMLGIFSKNIPESAIDETIAVLKKVIGNLQEEKSRYAGE
ncbi:DNA-binding transcriptional regulator, MarR family [Sporobacter termitidis DSM 10068]|uniref:DNA-binding transcriptional regulator, MarR family n=1 Tax=Sporobacter termitidis DSM 10068 TaxID=1123282 RepID=A0A1M5XSZ1_9FIRM|nr:MarR family winged helix-turn-helix transcriptional regulator [Sporobacter termitidis]SHI02896.1 DNA-binding transcriptional regulator, MarR family [Sporobacter termitidis DSM 10068]